MNHRIKSFSQYVFTCTCKAMCLFHRCIRINTPSPTQTGLHATANKCVYLCLSAAMNIYETFLPAVGTTGLIKKTKNILHNILIGSGTRKNLKAIALLQFNNDNGLDLSTTVFLSADESLCKWMIVKNSSVRMDSKRAVRAASYLL